MVSIKLMVLLDVLHMWGFLLPDMPHTQSFPPPRCASFMKFLFSTVSGPIPHTCHSAPHHPHPHTLTTATHHPQQSEPAGKKGWSPETQNVKENTILTKVCILPGRSSPSFTVVLNPSSSEGMQCYSCVHLIWQSSSRICQICNLTGMYIKRGHTNTSFFFSLSLLAKDSQVLSFAFSL